MKNQRVNVTPGAPKGHEVYGTIKTVLGVPVIEVHAGFYVSPDLRFSLYRRANEHAETYARGNWMIEDAADRRSFSDPIPTKREAFEALVEWQEYAAKQDAAREAERAARRR